MLLYEQEVEFESPREPADLCAIEAAVRGSLRGHAQAIRFAVTATCDGIWRADVAAIAEESYRTLPGLFAGRERARGSAGFNVALVIPTGIGSEVGGHAGDAGAAAKMLASLCDSLITHPNVVNGSDINELPANGLYVEGSILTRFLLGTIGLQPVRSNRVLVVLDDHEQAIFTDSAINAVNAARAAYGLDCAGVIAMRPGVRLRARFAPSGRAAGRVEGLEELLRVLEVRRDKYDAVAVSSVIDVPEKFHREYFERGGEMVNPWGGVEAMLTHALSSILNVPTAHAPMFESEEIANMDPGVVDPRMAAEAVSQTFLQCTLKGLSTAPRIVTDETAMGRGDVLTAGDVSCLVMPDGCLGLPTLAAIIQGIPVIAVREARNILKNDLTELPWRPGQFRVAETMLEAAGMVAALKAGITLESVRRPLHPVTVERISSRHAMSEATPAADPATAIVPDRASDEGC